MNRTRTSKKAKRLLVWLLMLTMVFSLLPMAAFADEAVAEPVVEEPVQDEQPSAEPTTPAEPSEEPEEPSEEPAQEPTEEPADAEEPTEEDESEVDTQAADVSYVIKNQDVPLKVNGDMGYRIVHIDCGRKYFEVSELKQIIDYAYKYGYTHVELAFGNDGLRFLLEDMSLTVGGVTYESDDVKTAIQNGNVAYAGAGELSQSEMDEIIKYAKSKGIGIIPMFDAPGHLQAVIKAMQELKISMVEGTDYCVATKSGTSFNWALITTSAIGSEFVQNLVQKYIDYFAANGCTMFNIAADECGFQYNSDTNWRKMTDAEYTAYAKFVNSLAARVQNAGMTALAFNDGIYHKGLTSDTAFDTSIAICYWDASTDKYASATDLASKGFKIINTNNKWYYVLGSEGTDWFGFQWSQGYMNGTDKDCHGVDGGYSTTTGCMLALWCDNPSASVNWDNVETHIKTLSSNNSEYFKQQTAPAEEPVLTADPTGSIAVGDTVTLTLSNYEGDVTWSCDNEDVLAVEGNGNSATAKALKAGTATVTATMADEKAVTISIEVTETAFEGKTEDVDLFIDGDDVTKLLEGTADTVTDVELRDADGNVIAKYSVTNTPGTEATFEKATLPSTENYYVVKNPVGGYMTRDGGTTNNLEEAAQWRFYSTGNGNNKSYYMQSGNKYLYYLSGLKVADTAEKVYYYKEEIYGTRTKKMYGSGYNYSNVLTLGTVAEGTEAKNEIVFTAVMTGTSSVIIGDVKYNVTVHAADLGKVTPLPIQLWITNNTIEASGSNAGATGSGWGGDESLGSARYINIPAVAKNEGSSINSEQGMSVVDAISAAGMSEPLARYEWGGTRFITARDTKPVQNLVFWTGRIHNSSDGNIQTVWGTDYSISGDAFTYIRYYNKAWQVSADREEWVNVTGAGSTGSKSGCTQQLAAYYMTRTEITKEITTDVADWGKPKGGTEFDNQVGGGNFVLLDFAVAYQSGDRVPTGFPAAGKTLAYHCETGADYVGDEADCKPVGQNGSYYYRRLNNFRAVETGDFEVYMVTVTMTSADAGTTLSSDAAKNGYTYDKTTEQIVWAIDDAARAASGLEDYSSISGSSTFSGCKIGGEPNIRGVEVYDKHGALITYYIRAKQTVTDKLTVNYYVDGETKPFYTYDIVVDENTTFDHNFARTENPVGLVYNTVVNSVDKTETVNWELELLPQISAQYRYTDYDFVRTDFTGNDYKVVNLYYTFKAEKTFVVDFGLPLVITPRDINANLAANGVQLTKVDVSNVSSYASVIPDDNCNVTYKLNKTIDGKDNFGLQYSGTLVTGDNKVQAGQTAKYSITIIPASNVYYEDGFATFNNGTLGAEWKSIGSSGETNQALEALGNKENVYGYDDAYKSSTEFSLGTAQSVEVTNGMLETANSTGGTWPTASFTFTGTGFDVISLTNNKSGAIIVNVYEGDKVGGTLKGKYFVDNYYGYTKNDAGEWVVDNSGNDCLYQIPVMQVRGLTHGEYTAEVVVFYNSAFDDTSEGDRYSFWFDGFRVYDPLGKDYSDYSKDDEGYPQYIKLRPAIIDGNTNGTVLFIDGSEEADIEDYTNYGPNNEAYLAKGQAISFKLDGNLSNIASVQIGAKAPAGTANLNVNKNEIVENGIATATEMYYDITEQAKAGGTVTITNTSSNEGNILSLTNIKVTFDESGKEVSLAAMTAADQAEAVSVVRALFAEPITEPDPFEPDYFEASWNSNVRKGGRAVLTVKTSEDVESIVIDGDVTVEGYVTRTERTGWGWNAKRVTYRVFTYTITAEQSASYSVAAVNSAGVQSEAKTADLTVRPASPIRDWIGGLFGRWF